MRAGIVLWCALAALPGSPAAAEDAPSFTESEVRAILAHGPWPAAASVDPSNRVSGKREAVELGERLFFDERLSASGKFSCGTCHLPERNWTDNRTRGEAAAEVDRNTPTLMNIRLGRWFGWDGASDSLWSQSIRPILDPRELGASPSQVADLVRNDGDLACRYRKAFGQAPAASEDERLLVDVGKALAAFEETLESPLTPFDQFRDALARGERVAPWRYSEAAQRGLKIFIGKGGCDRCHSGPNFSDGEFHVNGFSALGKRADAGRSEGVGRLRESRFNLLGAYNDDPARSSAEGTRRVLSEGGEPGAFKVPTLRHMLLTAPYGHHGEIERLAGVVRHYSETGGPGELRPLHLTAAEQTDLVVFLESLSTFSNPWRPDEKGRCE
ncbi:MAG TPA: cytochrome c peroxidase [Burkholderiales bacterium]|nr:cytochrome c peroxidase [Burkholderiales bacterium]